MYQSDIAQSTSPGASSGESENENYSHNNSAGPWQVSGSSPQAPRVSAPLQKRRRVTRACDECRRKKIKCDGKQPCTHCTVYSYDCTYDQPSNRRRNPAPQYIEALENRLQKTESLLRALIPNVDLNDPTLDAAALIRRRQIANIKDTPQNTPPSSMPSTAEAKEQDAHLRSMIVSTGQLDLDDRGNWDFHGGSSGTVFVRRLREEFGSLLGSDDRGSFLPRVPRPAVTEILFNSPKSAAESPFEAVFPASVDLPSRDTARRLCSNTLDRACCLLRFVHQPTFYAMFDKIYDIPVEDYGNEENRFLSLLYVILGLGYMFDREPEQDSSDPGQLTYKICIEQGYKFYRVARQMIEITDCRDITSLQAIVFMILFLQSTANLSTCYSYIGIALRSAIRMGLHRNLTENFNPIERETRRRVFWIVRKMDTYVSAQLGFPMMLSYDDIDQELPLEVDDEFLTSDTILSMPPGRTSLYAAPNAHAKLMAILAKVIKNIYPLKAGDHSIKGSSNTPYIISYVKIREIERDLASWLDKLPMSLRPGGDGVSEILRAQQLLRLAYAHVQMMLYRPFLHYASPKACSKTIDDRSYACAAACISVSRNIIHITAEMRKTGLLDGAYWFTMYTTYFAILSLVFFVIENPDKPGSQEILQDANSGNDALRGLAKRSMAADRCAIALTPVFKQLPERLKNGRSAPILSAKKRAAPSDKPSTSRSSFHMSPGSPSLESKSGFSQVSRATTFPISGPISVAKAQRASFDEDGFQMEAISDPNLRRSYSDLRSPQVSTTGTPESNSGSSVSQSQYGQQSYNSSNLPDLDSMMFSSADPFAYPNQPIMGYENIKPENSLNTFSDSPSRAPPTYLSNVVNGNETWGDIEGQLFGILPPYIIQGQQMQTGLEAQMDGLNNLGAGLSPISPSMNYEQSNLVNNMLNINNGLPIFDGTIAEGDDWSSFNYGSGNT